MPRTPAFTDTLQGCLVVFYGTSIERTTALQGQFREISRCPLSLTFWLSEGRTVEAVFTTIEFYDPLLLVVKFGSTTVRIFF